MKTTFSALLLGLAAVFLLPAHAAEFTVSPVRIFMTPRERAVAVTIINDGAEEIVMQADVYSWKQNADGTDDLKSTDDLVLSPPILKVPPRSRQVVRLARLTAPPTAAEETYRLIVREIPEARSQRPGEVGLQLALAFSLPVFITPTGAKRAVSCELQRTTGETVRATCANDGRAYAQARSFDLIGAGGEKVAARETGGYILPGSRRAFDITRSAGRIPAGRFKLQVSFDDGTAQTFDVSAPE